MDRSILSKSDVWLRNRLIEKIDLQIEAVKAREEGSPFVPYVKRLIASPETCEKELKDVCHTGLPNGGGVTRTVSSHGVFALRKQVA